MVEAPSEFLITSTDWVGYQKIREALWNTGVRITYARGRIQLMAPSPRHGKRKSLAGMLLEQFMLERGIDFEVGGSTTFQDQAADQGLEPDECYWIGSFAATRGQEDEVPRPDLVIEVEVSRTAMDRLPLFARMGVPELWRFTRTQELRIYQLVDGTYRERPSSPTFPELCLSQFQRHMAMGRQEGASRALRSWRGWLTQPDP
ncbi:MAG: Uma2 family endonuclease [Candidatus Eremiobacterota bacterium]